MYKINTIKKKTDFTSTMKQGRKFVKSGFVVFILNNENEVVKHASINHSVLPIIKVGYTVSGKVGNAVFRNRVKRRIKHLAEESLIKVVSEGNFNVSINICFVGRYKAYFMDFNHMKNDFLDILKKYNC